MVFMPLSKFSINNSNFNGQKTYKVTAGKNALFIQINGLFRTEGPL